MDKLGEKRFVLDCSTDNLGNILKQAQQVGLITSAYSFFITSLDLHTVNLENYKYGGTNSKNDHMISHTHNVCETNCWQRAVRRIHPTRTT